MAARVSHDYDLDSRYPPPGEYLSRGLELTLSLLGTTRTRKTLDLGAAHGVNLEAYSPFSEKVFFADLFRSRRERFPEEALSAEILEQLIPTTPSFQFDAIFCWDILNYLQEAELETLIRFLVAHSGPKTVIFALYPTRESMTETPTDFRILGSSLLAYDQASLTLRAAPAYSQRHVRELFPDFKAERVFLLRNGMQEVVYAKSERVASDA